MKNADRVFGVIGLALSLWSYFESTKFNYRTEFTPGPGFFPFWVGVILAVFSCWLLIDSFRRPSTEEDKIKILPEKHSLYRVGFIFLMLFGVKMLMPFLGFPLTICLFVAGILFSLERCGMIKSIGYGLAYAAVTWVIFEHFMEMGFPKGFLGI